MELSTKHRASFLAAIPRVDLTEIEQTKLRSVQDTLYLGSQTGYTNSESWSLKNQPEESSSMHVKKEEYQSFMF